MSVPDRIQFEVWEALAFKALFDHGGLPDLTFVDTCVHLVPAIDIEGIQATGARP